VQSCVNARMNSVRGSVGASCSACDYSYVLSIMHGCEREFEAIVQVSDKCTCVHMRVQAIIILSRLIASRDIACVHTLLVCVYPDSVFQ
jgi:hypothetical protein